MGFFICYFGFTRLQFDVKINPSCVLLTSLVQHLLIKYLAEDWAEHYKWLPWTLSQQLGEVQMIPQKPSQPHIPIRCGEQDFGVLGENQTSELVIQACLGRGAALWSRKVALQPPAAWLTTCAALQAAREQGREPQTTASRKLANEMSRIKYYLKSLGEIHWSWCLVTSHLAGQDQN